MENIVDFLRSLHSYQVNNIYTFFIILFKKISFWNYNYKYFYIKILTCNISLFKTYIIKKVLKNVEIL